MLANVSDAMFINVVSSGLNYFIPGLHKQHDTQIEFSLFLVSYFKTLLDGDSGILSYK
jgi:hypothetical protein